MAVADAASYNHAVGRKLTAQLACNEGSKTRSCGISGSSPDTNGTSSRLPGGTLKDPVTNLSRNSGGITGSRTGEARHISNGASLHAEAEKEAASVGKSTARLDFTTGLGRNSNRPRYATKFLQRLFLWMKCFSTSKLKDGTTCKKISFPRNPAMPRSKVRFPEDRESLYHMIPKCHYYIFTVFILYITFELAFIVAPTALLIYNTVCAAFPAEAPPESTSLIHAPEDCGAITRSSMCLSQSTQFSQHSVTGDTTANRRFSTHGHLSPSSGTTATCQVPRNADGTGYHTSSSSNSSGSAPRTSWSIVGTRHAPLLLAIGIGIHVWILRYYLLHLFTKCLCPGHVERQFSVDMLLIDDESDHFFSPARPVSPLCGRYGFTPLKAADPVILALISPISGGKVAMVYYQELVLPELRLLFGPRTRVVPMILEESVAHVLSAFLRKWSYVFDIALILGGDGAFHTIVNLLAKVAMEEAADRYKRGDNICPPFQASSSQAALLQQKNGSSQTGAAMHTFASEDRARQHGQTDSATLRKDQHCLPARTHAEASQGGQIDAEGQSECCCACWGKDTFYPLDLVISPVPLGTSNTWCSEFVFSPAGPIAARFYAAMARKDAAECVAQLEGRLAGSCSKPATDPSAQTELFSKASSATEKASPPLVTPTIAPSKSLSASLAWPETPKATLTYSRLTGIGGLGDVCPYHDVTTDKPAVSEKKSAQKDDARAWEARKNISGNPLSPVFTQVDEVIPSVHASTTSGASDQTGGFCEDRRFSDDIFWGDSELLTLPTTDSIGDTCTLNAPTQNGLAAGEKQTEKRNRASPKEGVYAEVPGSQHTTKHAKPGGNLLEASAKDSTSGEKRKVLGDEAAVIAEQAAMKADCKIVGSGNFSADLGTTTNMDDALVGTASRFPRTKHPSSFIVARSELEKHQSLAACAAASAALEDAFVAQEMADKAALSQEPSEAGMSPAATFLESGCAGVATVRTAAAARAAREAVEAAEEVEVLLGEHSPVIPEEGRVSLMSQQERDDLFCKASPIISIRFTANCDAHGYAQTAVSPGSITNPCTKASTTSIAATTGDKLHHAAEEIVALLAAEAGEKQKALSRLRQDSQHLKSDTSSPDKTLLHRVRYYLKQAERLDELALQIGSGKDGNMTKMGREKLLHFWLRSSLAECEAELDNHARTWRCRRQRREDARPGADHLKDYSRPKRIRECRTTRVNALLVEANGEQHICCNSLEFGFIGTAQVHSEDLRWLGHMRYTGAFLYHLITMRKFCAYIEAVLPNGTVVHKIGEYMVIALDVVQHWTDDRPVARQAQMDGPCAWLLLLGGKISRARLLSYMMDLRRLSVAMDKGLEMIPVKEVKVKMNDPGIFGLDGEVYRHDGELKFTLLPGFMRVCVSQFDQMIAQPAVGHRWMKYLRNGHCVTSPPGAA